MDRPLLASLPAGREGTGLFYRRKAEKEPRDKNFSCCECKSRRILL